MLPWLSAFGQPGVDKCWTSSLVNSHWWWGMRDVCGQARSQRLHRRAPTV